MDGTRFDDLTRAFGRGLTRRRFAAAVGSALVGAVGSSGLVGAAKCRKTGSVCRNGGDCCSGACSDKDATGRRRCICPAGSETCKGDCVDPASAYASDPKNCGSCGNVCQRTRCAIAVCNAGVCGTAPDPNMVGRSCNDGNRCTEHDVCQADGSCVGTPVTCSVAEPKCQTATCNPASGRCETTNLPVGTSCADDDRCDGEEACDGNGACAAGTPVSCANLDTDCMVGVCDPTTGTCSAQPKPDRTACEVVVGVGTVSGYCCGGLCSECCGTANDCLPASEVNIEVACIPGRTQCLYTCPWNTPTCTNPAITDSNHPLSCRLAVGAQCSADTQCCGFCVNGTCQDGATGSPCADTTDCASGLFCNAQSVCAQPLLVGAACVPSTDTCVAGASCGSVLQTTGSFCCRPIGSACSVDQQCCQDGGVQERCVLGVCKTRGQAGAACGKTFDCFGPLVCINGVCGTRSALGGTCDSDDDCAFDSASNTHPVCSGGTCKLPNGAACTSGADCGIGVCLDCGASGHICAECCLTGGLDPVDCGDVQSEKLCCNHQCVYRNNDQHCGACNVDCTCGGADPYRYCTTQYDSQSPSWDWPAVCAGTYSAASGHCENNAEYCATTCPPPPAPCDCTASNISLFCFASCQGQFPELTLSTCYAVGEACLNGNDDTCCGSATCVQHPNCSPGAVFCLSNDYICVGA